MAAHFDFLALPTELQMRIISFTDLVNDVPARDLCHLDKRDPNTHYDITHDLAMCCGRCEGRRPVVSTCPCEPYYRFAGTSCECLIFAQPLLAVSRHVRAMALDYIYRHATFELGPNLDAFEKWLKRIRKLDSAKTERVRRLRLVFKFEHDEDHFREEIVRTMRKTWFWLDLLGALRRKFTRHDVRVKLVITPTCFGVKQLARQIERCREQMGITNVDVVTRSETWMYDRCAGRTVE